MNKSGAVACTGVVTLALGALPACDGERQDRAARVSPVEQAPELVAKPLAARATRGRIMGGEKLARQVTMPRAKQLDLDVRSRLSSAVLDQLPLAPAPVLVPRAGQWAAVGKLHTGPVWTAFEAHDHDVHVNVSASTQARLHPDVRSVEFPDIVRGHQGFVTRNEGVWSASWIENGVAYSLEVECGAGANPATCADDRELRALAESLVFVGGGEMHADAGGTSATDVEAATEVLR